MPFFQALSAPFSRRLAAIAGLLLLGLPLPSRSAADPDDGTPVQLTVKRRKILVPPPNGMVSVMGQDWLLDAIFQANVQRNSYLEAVFIPSFAWTNYVERRRDDLFLADFAIVQTRKRLPFDDQENCDTFDRLRTMMDNSFHLRINSTVSPLRPVLDASNDEAAKDAASSLDIEETQMIPLSIMRSDNHAFSAICATRYTATVDGQKKSWMMVVGLSMVLTQDRIVYLYKYKRGPPDPLRVGAIRRSMAEWTSSVLGANT